MAVFVVLWSCLFTTKLRYVICHNLGHSKLKMSMNNPHLLRLKKYIHFILYCFHSHRSRLRSYKVQTSFCFFYVGNDRSYYKIRFCMKQLTRYKGVKFANTPYKMSILHHSSFFFLQILGVPNYR